MENPEKKLQGWREKAAAFQTALLLNLLYFFLGSIVTFFMQLFRYSPFQNRKQTESFWCERKPIEPDFDSYQRQF
ncbi:hypothetical protein JW992_16015 [candidate division KSB1 bacterium]|nr:hypothetical protein [candidate division KSB1 bacterium]